MKLNAGRPQYMSLSATQKSCLKFDNLTNGGNSFLIQSFLHDRGSYLQNRSSEDLAKRKILWRWEILYLPRRIPTERILVGSARAVEAMLNRDIFHYPEYLYNWWCVLLGLVVNLRQPLTSHLPFTPNWHNNPCSGYFHKLDGSPNCNLILWRVRPGLKITMAPLNNFRRALNKSLLK